MADAPAPSSQNMDGFWLIAILSLVFFAWVSQGGPKQFEAEKNATSTWRRVTTNTSSRTSNTSSRTSNTKGDATSTKNSPYAGKVKISSKGSAASAIQVNLEYITLQNTTRDEYIAISGWKLVNGRDSRYFSTSSSTQLVYYKPDSVTIPYGTRYLTGKANNVLAPIVLGPKERAHIVTGKMPNQTPYAISSSFKLNRCVGYIEGLSLYKFTPAVSLQCPAPSKETDINALEQSCYDYIRRLSRCHTPEFKVVKGIDYVDSTTGLSEYCKRYVREHFSYSGCLARHTSDEDFLSPIWYVYLNYSHQLWDVNRDRILLYDAQGRLVDELKY